MARDDEISAATNPPGNPALSKVSNQNSHRGRRRAFRQVTVEEANSHQEYATNDIYLGSYNRTSPARQSAEIEPSPRASVSHVQLEPLLDEIDGQLDAFGFDEQRDGYFDAHFFRPVNQDHDGMMRRAQETLPDVFHRPKLNSMAQIFWRQLELLTAAWKEITTSRSGIRLLRSFLGFFIAYIICLIPNARCWLGKYSYIMVVSTIINHSGRAAGSQIDGAILTTLGTAVGLGWGSLALYVSTSTLPARAGYGGVLATFLILFTAAICWIRSIFLRFYQAILCAGIAISYACLADTSKSVGWAKVSAYIIPWALGQAINLVVCLLVFPASGTRALALSFHLSLGTIKQAFELPQNSIMLKRQLAWHFVDLSQAIRDFTIDLSVSPFHADDARSLRNLMQGVIRSVLAMKVQVDLFNHVGEPTQTSQRSSEFGRTRMTPTQESNPDPAQVIRATLRWPMQELLNVLWESICRVDAALMDISGHRKYSGPSTSVSSDVGQILEDLRIKMTQFDDVDDSLIGHPVLPNTYSDHPELVELFLFIHPLRHSASKVLLLLEKVLDLQRKKPVWNIQLPSYPFRKSLLRTNAQVRHDRGGLTAGFYFRTKYQLEAAMEGLQDRNCVPATLHRDNSLFPDDANNETSPRHGKPENKMVPTDWYIGGVNHTMFRYKLWAVLHRLQGVESRYALKVTLVTTLIAIPAWLPQSKDWWDQDGSWWAVVTIWIMMHPRVGGNIQDLFVRTLCAALGAVWGGLAYGAGGGNPYVTAVLAALFMIPMLYRFTISSHPRSGIIGCISFTVVSISAYRDADMLPVSYIAWTRGTAFIVGVVASVSTNWVLWPFVARHELRKSLATMMLYSAVLYRAVVARYIYYGEGNEPGQEDVLRSEILEGRLREGFVRIRQLMELTSHEIRLRAPFDPVPYSGLIQASEKFFGHLIDVRQSSLYFQPSMLAHGATLTPAIIAARRDAIATILMNLYTLAGALRSDRPVPRYLPSAAASRRRLLDRMEHFEVEQAKEARESKAVHGVEGTETGRKRRWADVYHYAYSSALTDIVENVQELEFFTKKICGEVGFNLKLQDD